MKHTMKAKQGSKVTLEYTGTLDNGTVFDTNVGKEALEFEIGGKQVIKGFEEEIIGMEEGEEKTFTLSPERAYGHRRAELIREIPKEKIKHDVKKGDVLGFQAPNGMVITAKVIDITDNSITVDLNPPLAGQNLTFKVKILKIH